MACHVQAKRQGEAKIVVQDEKGKDVQQSWHDKDGALRLGCFMTADEHDDLWPLSNRQRGKARMLYST